ncbi:MAG: hypothetical protein KVP17_003467 [Porospora cf. gigantea B]|uniref:uncharacterized protein n=1 Tax=Porospora cf. gigantea B TaxID=2853592 RepID=UPI003571E92C|nr:MAG: hypothetical protein KVP17_003467 [Porospora cf. gigantea B]
MTPSFRVSAHVAIVSALTLVLDVQDVIAHIFEESYFCSELQRLTRSGTEAFLEALAALNIEVVLFTVDQHEVFEEYLDSIDQQGIIEQCVSKRMTSQRHVNIAGQDTSIAFRDVSIFNRIQILKLETVPEIAALQPLNSLTIPAFRGFEYVFDLTLMQLVCWLECETTVVI